MLALQIKQIALNSYGSPSTITIPVNDQNVMYVLGGTHTMAGAIEITYSGTPQEGYTMLFYYSASLASYDETTNFLRFFNTSGDGKKLPTEYAVAKRAVIWCTYANSSWRVSILPDWTVDGVVTVSRLATDSVTTVKILDSNVTTAKIADLNVTTAKIAANAVTNAKSAQMAAHRIKGNNTAGASDPIDLTLTEVRTELADSITLTGDVTASSTPQTFGTGNTSVSTTIASGAVSTSKLSTSANTEVLALLISFESGEQTTLKWRMPFACTIQETYGIVNKAIAATDNGTITFKNNAGTTMTGGTITATASDALATAYGPNTVTANNTIASGDYLQITSSKVTAGGKVYITIKYLRT